MERYLWICAQIEAAVGTIYRGLADCVACSEEQRESWRQMAREEEEHARRMQTAADVQAFDLLPVRPVSRRRAELLLIRAHMVLMGMNGPPPVEEEALALGIRLEEEFREIHALSAREMELARLREVFEGLAREDERHLDRLQARLAEIV